MDKTDLELETGFRDFEHLAASRFNFSATFEICRDDRIVGRARTNRVLRARLLAARSTEPPHSPPDPIP
jgi:hypothetical protein